MGGVCVANEASKRKNHAFALDAQNGGALNDTAATVCATGSFCAVCSVCCRMASAS